MKGYKVFNADMTCRGFQYEVGKTYETQQAIRLCDHGFHFCKSIVDCFKYYGVNGTRFAEVEALGDIIEGDDKCVTNKIRVLKEISNQEAMDMSNSGNQNSGYGNSGYKNLGNKNSGDRNSGNRNSGNWNLGDKNSGNRNSGYGNSGLGNSGNWNSGNENLGNWNSGNCNSSDCNSGNGNSGNWNLGNGNSGDWNTSSFNNGCFMTIEPTIMLFNKPSDWTYRDWINSEARAVLSKCPCETNVVEWITEDNMSAAEKEKYTTYKTTGGYLKVTKSNADKQKWWDELPENYKRVVMSLPNFDAEIFRQCTGIEVDK